MILVVGSVLPGGHVLFQPVLHNWCKKKKTGMLDGAFKIYLAVAHKATSANFISNYLWCLIIFSKSISLEISLLSVSLNRTFSSFLKLFCVHDFNRVEINNHDLLIHTNID